MKKTVQMIFIVSIFVLMFVACSNEAAPNQTSETPLNQVSEDQPNQVNEAEGAQAESTMELIPMDELAILKNEPELYEGRPFADVPVEVISVERYSDRVVIEASLYETGSGHYFTLVQEGSKTDINQRDPLYIDGVVRNEIDTKKLAPSSATKVELTGYQKVEFADLMDPVVFSKEINMTLENELFSANVHKVDVGNRFTRIYFTPTGKDREKYIARFEADIITAEGEFPLLEQGDASKIMIKTAKIDGREVLVFENADLTNGFTLKLTSIPSSYTYEEEKVPLIFEVR